MYIHERDYWPRWEWNLDRLATPLARVRHEQGLLIGRMDALGLSLRDEAQLETITADVLKSSEIEGERLDAEQVRSSVARRLGLDVGALAPADRRVDGIVEMTLDATRNYEQPLTVERLCAWQAALFPTGRSGLSDIIVGAWRDDRHGPMQVVSGAIGRERVHYEVPAAGRIDDEMRAFLAWFNAPPAYDGVLKAALAHLWFVTVHPFEDGNGRVARAIADMALARSERSPRRFYSMSTQIRDERRAYYDILERTQQGTMDVTPWMEWFLGCLGRAIARADRLVGSVLRRAELWRRAGAMHLNDRQVLVLNRLLEGFTGHLTTSKYATLAKCSPDTALRDLTGLVDRGLLARGPGGGRSTHYVLVEPGPGPGSAPPDTP